ncbi:MAG: signal peptidase I [Prevotella sp.]|nr:signal peptidase I [Alistipes senegalensis]MCM1358116.1 signal peptidase I [Prevotella sp.]MCM1474556.1 signal peptidase I [Muribaculaceae bacterium]
MEENIVENTESESSNQEKNSDKNFLADFIEIAESTFITVFVIIMIFTYILHPVNVVGTSMTNTLQDGDRIFMTTIYGSLSYGDIVVINNDMSYLLDGDNKIIERNIDGSGLKECIIKRVIATGGQTVEVNSDTKEVIVDGKVLDEPYIKELTNSGGVFNYPITIPEGYYFCMGDNRNGSSDSRNADIGLIKKSQIYGKAMVRYAPVSEFKYLGDSYKHSNE